MYAQTKYEKNEEEEKNCDNDKRRQFKFVSITDAIIYLVIAVTLSSTAKAQVMAAMPY